MTNISSCENRCRKAADKVVKHFTELNEYLNSYDNDTVSNAVNSDSRLFIALHNRDDVTGESLLFSGGYTLNDDQFITNGDVELIHKALMKLCTVEAGYTHLTVHYLVHNERFKFLHVNIEDIPELLKVTPVSDCDVLAHSIMAFLTGIRNNYISYSDASPLVNHAMRCIATYKTATYFCADIGHMADSFAISHVFGSTELTKENAEHQLRDLLRRVECELASAPKPNVMLSVVTDGVTVEYFMYSIGGKLESDPRL